MAKFACYKILCMQIDRNINLKPYHTFGIDVKAREFLRLNHADILTELYNDKVFSTKNYLFLGEGSDVLFVSKFDGLIIKNELKGIRITEETDNKVFIRAASGENWHAFVEYCVSNGWGGLENLALIPGTVGASPIQNIGAYGVEIKDTLAFVEAFDLTNGEYVSFSPEELKLAYRWSIFKEEKNKSRYFITACTFRLSKEPELKLDYAGLKEELKGKSPTPKNVFEAVIAIRKRKLPDPAEYGNAGSFFKNPVISPLMFEELRKNHPELKGYPNGDKIKLPAAQLIDLCGWKGKVLDGAGVYKNQALVIVNFGHATGRAVYDLSKKIQASVKERFGIDLAPEVNIFV